MLDTNVLVSAYSWKGNEERVVSRCESKELQSITSQDIMDELGVVLVDKFEEPVIDVIRYIERIILMSEIVFPEGKVDVIVDDPSDNMVLETALLGEVDIIVSGDRHLLSLGTFQGIRVMRAAEVVRLIASR